ncbi:flagellar protein FlaG, partial [Oxalobacteraceae bacterium OM1]
ASVEAAQAPQPAKAEPNSAQIAQAIKNLNKAMESLSRGLEFSIDDQTDRTVVKVVDTQTKEVIRQIPTEETLEISRALDQATGLLIRQKA